MKKYFSIIFIFMFFASLIANDKVNSFQLITYNGKCIGTATPVDKNIAISTYHQIKNTFDDKFYLQFLDKKIKIELVAKFELLDLAVYRVYDNFDKFFKIYDHVAERGAKVFAQGYNPSISDYPFVGSGTITGFSTKNIENVIPVKISVILSDIRTNGGFSGGPLYYANGDLVGMICGRLFPIPDEASIGLYAIPAIYIKRVISLEQKIERIEFDVDFKIRFSTGTISAVADVCNENPNIGLIKDDVILNVDGINFKSEADLKFLLLTMSKSSIVKIQRAGKTILLNIP